MISRNALVRVSAAASDHRVCPSLHEVAAILDVTRRLVIHTIERRIIELHSVFAKPALVLSTTFSQTLTHLCAGGKTVPGPYAGAPSRSTAPLLTSHGCTCVTACSTICTIQSEIRTSTVTSGAPWTLQTKHKALGRFMTHLIEESRENHALTFSVFELNRLVLMKLRPRERDRVCTWLPRSHEWAEIHRPVLVLEAPADDVIDAVRIRQNRGDDHGAALRDLFATRTEVEEHRTAVLAPCTARREHARGVRRRSRAHRGGRWLTRRRDGRGIRGGTHGRARIAVATRPDQDDDAGNFAPELHGAQLATSPTGAQPIH